MWRLEIVFVGNIGNADDQNPHPATGTVDDPGRDVYQTTLRHGLLHPVEDDASAAVEDVVKLGGTLVVVELGAVNVHGVRPSRGGSRRVLVADEAVAPAAGTALAGGVTLVPNQQRARTSDLWLDGTHRDSTPRNLYRRRTKRVLCGVPACTGPRSAKGGALRIEPS